MCFVETTISFPYTALTEWFYNQKECVYCAVRTETLTVIQFIFGLQVAIADVKSKLYYVLFYVGFLGARGGVVVKALRYKPTGRAFDSR